MDKLIIRPKFDTKLKKLRIKTKFLKYCKNPKWGNPSYAERCVEIQNTTLDWTVFISHAFQWTNTPEGGDYWSNIAFLE